MRDRKVIFAACLAAAVSFLIPADCALAAAPSVPQKKELRVVAFGSSSTQGVGASRPSASYPAQLQSDLASMVPSGWSVEVINRGIGGEDADDMVKRLQQDVIGRHPDVVIWQTGSNDPMNHVPLDRFERETRQGVEAMQKADIDVILMEPQWCPRLETIASAVAYRDVIRQIGRDMGVGVVRRSDMMRQWISRGILTLPQMLSADGLHMADGGYAMLARSVAPEVLKLEDIASRPMPEGPKLRTASSPHVADTAAP